MHESPFAGADVAFATGAVHLWRVHLDGVSPSGNVSSDWLSEEERVRAAALRGPGEERRFIISRIALRHILARYQGVPPAALRVRREAGGKPFIEGGSELSFSLTHSGGLALLAVAGRPVGVDVERVRVVRRMSRILQRVMHEETAHVLNALPAEQRVVAFIDAWTQREAHVKALGGGVFRTRDDLPFRSAHPGDGSVVVESARSTGEPWSITRLVPADGWRATVVAKGHVPAVEQHDWEAP
jgi:4'-phosphopantetheinyl transferase